MVATVELKRQIVNIGIFGIIVYKFSYWQKACLVILLPIPQNSKVYLYYAIFSFGLAIGLRMERRKKSSLESWKIA